MSKGSKIRLFASSTGLLLVLIASLCVAIGAAARAKSAAAAAAGGRNTANKTPMDDELVSSILASPAPYEDADEEATCRVRMLYSAGAKGKSGVGAPKQRQPPSRAL